MLLKNLAVLSCSFGFFATTLAEDISFDFVHCYTATVNSISETGDDEFGTFEVFGVLRSNTDRKAFQNATSHCLGVSKFVNDQPSFLNYCKLMTPEKDWIVYEQQRTPDLETWDWSVVAAGGKWEGATGTGASKRLTKTQQVKAGIGAHCNQHVGTLKIPG